MAKPEALPAMLLDILAEGGARKIGILVAWAKSAGYGDVAIDQALLQIKRQGKVRQFMRRGGPHLEVVR